MRMLDFKPELVLACITRASSASAAGRSVEDAWHQFLQSKVTGPGTIADLEFKYLTANSGTGANISDKWANYLNARGFTTGNLKNRMRQFIKEGTLV